MKTIAIENKRNAVKPTKLMKSTYPNAADRRYYVNKLLDGLLAMATVVGALTVLVFFLFL